MATTETWLDIMPAIPITARCVPCIYEGMPAIALGPENACGNIKVLTCIGTEHWHVKSADVKVDVAEGVGFGFALRYAMQRVIEWVASGRNVHGAMSVTVALDEIVAAHIRGETTDDDRFILASALAQVTP